MSEKIESVVKRVQKEKAVKPVVKKTKTVSLQSPIESMNFANQLKEIIVKNKLYTDVKGKNYVNVEGWQIAGALTGIEAIVEKIENLSDEKTIRYRAEVSLYDTKRDGAKCGMGMAVCTNAEAGKKNFEEYAVASMAQTRAIGKAYRLKLGWLMKLAGYEPTPTEEITEAQTVKDDGPSTDEAITSLMAAKSKTELIRVWVALSKELKLKKEVVEAKDARKEELNESSKNRAEQ